MKRTMTGPQIEIYRSDEMYLSDGGWAWRFIVDEKILATNTVLFCGWRHVKLTVETIIYNIKTNALSICLSDMPRPHRVSPHFEIEDKYSRLTWRMLGKSGRQCVASNNSSDKRNKCEEEIKLFYDTFPIAKIVMIIKD